MEVREMEPGSLIWKQIPITTKMACGARDAVLIGNGLRFKVGGKPMHYIEVVLAPSDTYKVTAYRIKRGSCAKVVLEEYEDVYADVLGEVIYRAVNK
jgi:hypothetical protein